jgi:lysine-N-methylase
VQLLEGEEQRIASLNWPEGDPLRGASYFQSFAGHRVLAHRPSGACLFLDERTNRCRIHEKFGESVKPLGCRLFPFHITPTFKGEASVTARYDCPSVRQNLGQPHEAQKADLQRYAKAMNLSQEGFDEAARNGMSKEQIEACA